MDQSGILSYPVYGENPEEKSVSKHLFCGMINKYNYVKRMLLPAERSGKSLLRFCYTLYDRIQIDWIQYGNREMILFIRISGR